ncbi:CAMP-dependent_protein kinase regulatory chain [Hexamita inflata]|uniref:cAMP-dependent_protein kinase regulatory chain n=1 Tax=Hexamita inflata TaxID=28002 RepID=A0ABP1GEW2_9EUKA
MLPQYILENPEIGEILQQNLFNMVLQKPKDFTDSFRTSLEQAQPLVIEKYKPLGNDLIDMAIQQNQFVRGLDLKLTDFEEVEFQDGSEIVVQDDKPDYIYVLASGICDVIKNGSKVNAIEPGELFGELAFMFRRKRQATVIANGVVQCYRIHGRVFKFQGDMKGEK